MARYELTAYATDNNGIRYRSFTFSEKHAVAFAKIPKIRFTDSGHGIVFSARQMIPREKLTQKMTGPGSVEDYVNEHIKVTK